MKRGLTYLGLLLALAVLVWWLQGTTVPRPGNEATAPTSPMTPSSAIPQTPPATPPTVKLQQPSRPVVGSEAVAHVTAPPPDAPWPQQIRHWKSAAQNGDSMARCEYARHALRCGWEIQIMAADIRAQYHRANAQNFDRGDTADCRGITANDIDPAFDHLFAAAAQGHRESQLLFAAGAMMQPVPNLRRIEQLRRYRDEAGQFAWRAFAAGDSDAAVLLWRAYNRVGSNSLFLAGAIDLDPVKAHALDLLVGDLVPGFVVGSAAEAGLSDEQAMQARAMHAEWRGGAFVKAKPPRFGMQIENIFEWEHRAIDLCASDER